MKKLSLFLLLYPVILPAAQISWRTSVDLYQGATNADFVDATGEGIIAVNPSDPNNGTIYLNGVEFLRADLASLQSGVSANGVTLTLGPDSAGAELSGLAGPGTFTDGSFSGDNDIFNVLAGATYGHASVTFTGLTVGKTYAIQILVNDGRNNRSESYKVNLSDGLVDVPTSMANGTAGQADLDNRSSVDGSGNAGGDSIIGTFTADSSTQVFEIAGELDGTVNTGRAQINAIQLREFPNIIEAEDFTAMSGVVVETDKGDGTDSIGYLENGDWAEYLIHVPEPGTYRFAFSSATNSDGGDVQIVSNGEILGTVSIPKTSAWDNWQSFHGDATFATSGPQTIRLNFVGTHTSALFNLDWFSFAVPQVVPVVIGNTPKQTMRYGMDYERLWYWTGSLNSSERDLVAKWSVVDNDIDFIRVAINSKYELTEGEYDLSAYTSKIWPMMREMQEANPDIKFFASPRPLNEAVSGAAWQPYPRWITGDNGSGSFDFDWQKCADYLVRYIHLMKSEGFKISYLDVTNEWQSNVAGGRVTPSDVRDIAEYLKATLDPDDMPLIVAPSAWSYSQARSWMSGVNSTRKRDAIDVAAAHNTDKTGTAEDFVERVHDVFDKDIEIWNTEVHGWKSTSNADEVLTFSFMLEAINAGFSGLSGWLAIGTTNQGHSYILNPSGTPRRNVKYFIFNKLTNTSHRGQALDIETPAELSHTTALIKDNLLTVWAINPGSSSVDIALDLNGRTATQQTIIKTRWNVELAVEGEVSTTTSDTPGKINANIPAKSLCCIEIPLDPPGGPVTRLEAESYSAQSGVKAQATEDVDGEENIGWISDGDWLRFDGLELAENAFARFRIARPAGNALPRIEVRLNSLTGPIVGSVDVPLTAGWQEWETIETNLTNLAGTYDVYLVFQEIGSTTNASMMNLNWFALTMTETTVDPIIPENLLITNTAVSDLDQPIGTFSFSIPQSGLGQIYQVQVSDTMTGGSWADEGEPQTGTGGVLDFELEFPTSETQRFFRVLVSLP